MKNVVYIFGAGASKDFGLPLGNEIFQAAYGLSKSTNQEVSALGVNKLLKDTEAILKRLFSNLPKNKNQLPPFEEILTFMWDLNKEEEYYYNNDKYKPLFKSKAKEIFELLVNFFGATLIGSLHADSDNPNIRLFKKFIKSLDFHDNISFISFNYDTLLDDILFECVAENIIPKYTYKIPLYNIEEVCDYGNANARPRMPYDGVQLLKPHGSLNLNYCTHRQAPYGEGYFYNRNYLKTWTDQLKCPCCGSDLKRLMVPPLYSKHDFIQSTAYKKPGAWRSSPENFRKYIDNDISDCLAAADEIVVIGYSMPAYDFDFKSLLLRSLVKNKKRKNVHLQLITKGDNIVPHQFENLVGRVSITSNEGFLHFLKTNFQ